MEAYCTQGMQVYLIEHYEREMAFANGLHIGGLGAHICPALSLSIMTLSP